MKFGQVLVNMITFSLDVVSIVSIPGVTIELILSLLPQQLRLGGLNSIIGGIRFLGVDCFGFF